VLAQRELVVARVVIAVLDRFDGGPREVGDQHGHDHREAGERPGGDQPSFVGPQKSEQSVERVHSCAVNDYRRRMPGDGARLHELRLSLLHVRFA